jgi:hypothetical protein
VSVSPLKHTRRFAHQVLRISSFYPLPSGKIDHAAMQKWRRREVVINWLHTWNFGVGLSRMVVDDSMDISPLALWLAVSPDHLILPNVERQICPKRVARFASKNERSNRRYKPKLGVYSIGFTHPTPHNTTAARFRCESLDSHQALLLHPSGSPSLSAFHIRYRGDCDS